MTVTSQTNNVTYAGTGATTVFPVPMTFELNSEIFAILTEVATGIATEQTETTHYTLTGAGDPSGGELTMITPPPAGFNLYIYRSVALTQLLDFVANGSFPASSHESALDKITKILQQLKENIGRASIIAPWDTTTPPDITTIQAVSNIFPGRITGLADGNNEYGWAQAEPIDGSTAFQNLSGGLSSGSEGRARELNDDTSLLVGHVVIMMGVRDSIGNTTYVLSAG